MFFFWNESYFSKFIIKLRSDFRKDKLQQQSKTGEKGCLGQAKDLEAKKQSLIHMPKILYSCCLWKHFAMKVDKCQVSFK